MKTLYVAQLVALLCCFTCTGVTGQNRGTIPGAAPAVSDSKDRPDAAATENNRNLPTSIKETKDTPNAKDPEAPTGTSIRDQTDTSTTRDHEDASTTRDESAARESGPRRPHIVMIVADDLGWNDVSWRDRTMHTPVLSKLAADSVILNQSYVQPVCSPSRAAFMSGFYPYHLGMQHDVSCTSSL